MSKLFEIRWHGRGGQGTVTGAKSLAEAVQGTGKFVSAFPEYGPERRGAPVRAYDRFSDERIRIHIPVRKPDVVIVVDPTLIGTGALVEGTSENTVFLVNTEKPATEVKASMGLNSNRLYTVPANKISYELFKREIPNSAMMGAFAKACPHVITVEKLLEEAAHVFSHLLGEELVAKNLEAIKRGAEEGDEA